MSENRVQKPSHGGGPKTPEGKRRSALNATRHGLTAETIILPGENRGAFQELLDDYVEDLRPATRFELDLVHELAITRWRQMRLWTMESTVVQIGMKRSEQAALAEFQGQLADNVRHALAFIEMSGDTRAMQLINRYEARLMRRFHQILSELKSLQNQRRVEQASACDPATESNCQTNSAKASKPARVIPIGRAKPSPDSREQPQDPSAPPKSDAKPDKTPSGGTA